ncbi:unnamed protein product [Gongylonema pulchrum]|uniref:MFS domain-containing protein n=1 Tax=Gongylonema pulchrum TaxID=637853 RepID=A0A183DTF9_9BILA|nr:unnamed protein product [Gongylonema pulchrum]
MMILGLFLSPLSLYSNMAELFILSRLIAGIAVGMSTMVQSVFLTEISPVGCRGLMGTMTGLSTNIGVLTSSALGLPQIFGTDTLWPYVFYIEMLPCFMLIVYAIFVLHESPLYFLRRNDEKQAQKAVEFYYSREDNSYRVTKQLEMELHSQIHHLRDAGWMVLWTDRATRRALYFSIILNGTVSFSGIIAMSFFGTFLLNAIGFSEHGAALANCISSLAGTAGILVGAITIDNIGRRFLLIGSMVSLVAVNTGMMALVSIFLRYHFIWLGYGFLLLFNVFLFVFRFFNTIIPII